MKVKHYDQMMGWLTRPGYADGGRIGLQRGSTLASQLSVEEYVDIVKNMVADPTYVSPTNINAKELGRIPNLRKAKEIVKLEVGEDVFEKAYQANLNRGKKERAKEKRKIDPDLREKYLAGKAETRRQRRVKKTGDKIKLTPNEKLLNFEQSLIQNQLNAQIKANPDLILKDKKLMDQLSTTVSKEGNIIKIKPNLSDIKNRGIYEIEHQRDIYKKGHMKDHPYNRNLILGPHNREGGFKKTAETFIKKNPKSSKVDNILKIAEDLKVTLQPDVPSGTFQTKGLGYKQIGHPVEKFKSVAKATMPALVDDKLGMAGYTKNKEQMRRALGGPQLNAKIPFLSRLVEEVAAIPEEFKAKKYWKVGLKGLGLAFTPLMAYDGYQAAKAGKPVGEVIEAALIGTEGIYKAKEYFNMSPEAKDASSRINMQKMAEAGMQDPRVRGGGEFKADFIQEGDKDLILSEQEKFRIGREQEDALRAQQRANVLKQVYGRMRGQPVYMTQFAGGGIAGLSGGKRFGPPPIAGPSPQGGGLSTMFNRVKPW